MNNTLLRCLVDAHCSAGDSDELKQQLLDLLPEGSGFDNGIKLKSCTRTRVVFSCDFHHMDNGYYCGWSKHKCVLIADLSEFCGFDFKITGRDKRKIKSYISETMYFELTREILFVNGKPTLKG
jgi:hypothetical protein